MICLVDIFTTEEYWTHICLSYVIPVGLSALWIDQFLHCPPIYCRRIYGTWSSVPARWNASAAGIGGDGVKTPCRYILWGVGDFIVGHRTSLPESQNWSPCILVYVGTYLVALSRLHAYLYLKNLCSSWFSRSVLVCQWSDFLTVLMVCLVDMHICQCRILYTHLSLLCRPCTAICPPNRSVFTLPTFV